MKVRAAMVALVALALAPSRTSAQTLLLGPEFPVNTYTTGAQSFPAVAASPNGTFVVVWDSSKQDSGGDGVFGQRFNAFGAKVGAEFQVNTYTTDRQISPAVAMDSQGKFVVVWRSDYQDGSFAGIYGQRYDAAGAPVGGGVPGQHDDGARPAGARDRHGAGREIRRRLVRRIRAGVRRVGRSGSMRPASRRAASFG